MDRMNRTTAPTSSLPPLARLSSYSSTQIKDALDNIRAIYFPPPPPTPGIKLAKRNLKLRHLIHDQSVPDSGYVSAEEEDTEDTQIVEESVTLPSSPINTLQDEEEDSDLDVLRSDTFERTFSIKWLTGLTARADIWLSSLPAQPSNDDEAARALLIDAAASLLAAFVSPDPATAEPALTRTFALSPITVSLNDAPLLAADHTSVGLQSWASSILLAERLAAAPAAFGLAPGARILELGAGTGLLGIAAAKLVRAWVVATDFHADVLANLRRNVAANGAAVDVRALDWETPVFAPPLDAPFDAVLAADVVYHPLHAAWIRQCVVRLLRKPVGAEDRGGVFWMIIALRATGRHDGLAGTVNEVFGRRGEKNEELELVILEEQVLERQKGRGRADEGGYRLFKIGWTKA